MSFYRLDYTGGTEDHPEDIWRVMVQTDTMKAPAFHYFETKRDAIRTYPELADAPAWQPCIHCDRQTYQPGDTPTCDVCRAIMTNDTAALGYIRDAVTTHRYSTQAAAAAYYNRSAS
mgnify:CR=1 FL=1